MVYKCASNINRIKPSHVVVNTNERISTILFFSPLLFSTNCATVHSNFVKHVSSKTDSTLTTTEQIRTTKKKCLRGKRFENHQRFIICVYNYYACTNR